MSQYKQQGHCGVARRATVARVIGWLREAVVRPPGHWTLSRDGRLVWERSLERAEG